MGPTLLFTAACYAVFFAAEATATACTKPTLTAKQFSALKLNYIVIGK
jgi:hypothetical protein